MNTDNAQVRFRLTAISFLICVYLCSSAVLTQPLRADTSSASLLSNGNFRTDADVDGWPDGWPRPEGATWERDGDGRFIRMTGLGTDKMPTLFRSIPLHAQALQLKFRARATNVVPGKEKWNDARIIMHFRDKDGRELYPEPELRTYSGSTDGWVKEDALFKVPEGATTLQFIPAMFNCTSGTFDLTDIELIPVPLGAIEARRLGTPVEEPVPAVTDLRAGPQLPALKVAGPQLQDAAGKAVRLQGINVPSLEWSPTGEGVLHSIRIAAGEWKANAIRLHVSDRFWFGKSPEQRDGGAAYRALVDAAIHLAATQGAYTVLDLHRSGTPDPACADFWTSAAARYKDHPAVLFGLFREVAGTSWPLWRDGGEVVQHDAFGRSTPIHSPGMQGLVNAIRQAGASNVLVVGGLDGASDLSGIDHGYALTDRPGAAGIIYDVHLSPWQKDWQAKVLPLAARYPIFVGECGIDPRGSVPRGQTPEDPYLWAPGFFAALQQHQLHWAAAALHPAVAHGPRLIDTWQYEPTPFWGSFVRVALAGAHFRCPSSR